MDQNEFKLYSIGIDKKEFGRTHSFIDFGNVDYWYEKDERDCEGNLLLENEKFNIPRLALMVAPETCTQLTDKPCKVSVKDSESTV